jgi:hypothetical protein
MGPGKSFETQTFSSNLYVKVVLQNWCKKQYSTIASMPLKAFDLQGLHGYTCKLSLTLQLAASTCLPPSSPDKLFVTLCLTGQLLKIPCVYSISAHLSKQLFFSIVTGTCLPILPGFLIWTTCKSIFIHCNRVDGKVTTDPYPKHSSLQPPHFLAMYHLLTAVSVKQKSVFAGTHATAPQPQTAPDSTLPLGSTARSELAHMVPRHVCSP